MEPLALSPPGAAPAQVACPATLAGQAPPDLATRIRAVRRAVELQSPMEAAIEFGFAVTQIDEWSQQLSHLADEWHSAAKHEFEESNVSALRLYFHHLVKPGIVTTTTAVEAMRIIDMLLNRLFPAPTAMTAATAVVNVVVKSVVPRPYSRPDDVVGAGDFTEPLPPLPPLPRVKERHPTIT